MIIFWYLNRQVGSGHSDGGNVAAKEKEETMATRKLKPLLSVSAIASNKASAPTCRANWAEKSDSFHIPSRRRLENTYQTLYMKRARQHPQTICRVLPRLIFGHDPISCSPCPYHCTFSSDFRLPRLAVILVSIIVASKQHACALTTRHVQVAANNMNDLKREGARINTWGMT